MVKVKVKWPTIISTRVLKLVKRSTGRRVAQLVEHQTWIKGRGFESAMGKICTALFSGAAVLEITLVVEKDVKL